MSSELLPLSHNPAMPVRNDVIGEVVFVEAWQRFMASPSPFYFEDEQTRLDGVLSQYGGRAGQREATVCASVICWFGTNCGRAFLGEARKFREKCPNLQAEDAYLSAWSIENKRASCINSNMRTLEHCLSTTTVPASLGSRRIPAELSADDYECADCLARWLGSDDGQKFLGYCDAEIQRRLKPIEFPFDSKAGGHVGPKKVAAA